MSPARPTIERHRAFASAFLTAAALCAHSGVAPAQQPKPVVVLDRIVAVVNNEVITRADLDLRLRSAMQNLKQQGTLPPPGEPGGAPGQSGRDGCRQSIYRVEP